MIKVAINGYGRIGRITHRTILEKYREQIEIVGINAGSSTDIFGWMYLLRYDSVYGPLPIPVAAEQNSDHSKPEILGNLLIEGKKIPVFSQKDPSSLPWASLKVDVVIESTGHFLTEEKLKQHLASGAKAVVLSAPVKDGEVPTYVLGVNAKDYKGENLINNASCTTNCITPVAKVITDNFGVEKAMMTTVHGYTSDQRLQDGGHKDYRRARAAGLSIIPTTTGATIAASQALPELKGLFEGLSLRVPVPVGSLSDFTFVLKRQTTKEEINDVFKKAAADPNYSGILMATEDPIVSSDIIGNPYSAIVDLSLTQVVGGNLVKVIAWYDNEYGYANRLVEEVIMVGQRLSS
jgi:glyceraldehyde 3-phosphate dehydrogenase